MMAMMRQVYEEYLILWHTTTTSIEESCITLIEHTNRHNFALENVHQKTTKKLLLLHSMFPNIFFTEFVPFCHENPVKRDERTNRVIHFEGSCRVLDCQ